jgi:hypothetical protein
LGVAALLAVATFGDRSSGKIAWAVTALLPFLLEFNSVLVITHALNNVLIVTIFLAQVEETLVSASAKLFDTLGNKLTTLFNIWLISRIPWLTSKMIADVPVINK